MDEKSIKILEAIIMFGPITGPDILSYLEKSDLFVNIKTVYATIEKWNYLFSNLGDGSLEIIGQKKIGYHLNHGYFSKGQRLFLEDAINSSKLLSQQEKKHTKDLLDIFPSNQSKLPEQGFMHRLSVISQAIELKKTIKFSYFDYVVSQKGKNLTIEKKYRETGNISKTSYLISPYEIMMERGQYYVLCYCDKYPDNVTIFRIDRMDKVRTVKNEYFDSLKDIVDYEGKKQQMIHMFIGHDNIEDIRIKFKKDIFRTIVDEFGTNISLSQDIDGEYIFELHNFAMSEGLISWIMMMGEQVEVLAPISLKQEIYIRLEKLLKKYKGEY